MPLYKRNICDQFKHGKEMRERLKALDKCDACLTRKADCASQCTRTRFQCAYCRSYLH